MKRNPIVIVTLLVLVLLALPVGNLYAAGRVNLPGHRPGLLKAKTTSIVSAFSLLSDGTQCSS